MHLANQPFAVAPLSFINCTTVEFRFNLMNISQNNRIYYFIVSIWNQRIYIMGFRRIIVEETSRFFCADIRFTVDDIMY